MEGGERITKRESVRGFILVYLQKNSLLYRKNWNMLENKPRGFEEQVGKVEKTDR